MPLRPAARITAKARYGLQAASTERNSTRVELPLCGLYIGTRMRAERLLCPQQTYAGASPPAPAVRSAAPHNRLYEFTHWLHTAVISGACRSSPAMNARAVFDSWNSAPAS